MIRLNMVDQNDFIIEADLEGVTYFLRFSWNSEAGIWVMHVENSLNEAILSGLVLAPNVGLSRGFHYLGMPPGEFVAYTDDRTKQRIGRDDFITEKAIMYYVLEAELAAL